MMNYLTVEKLSKSIGEKELFSEITFGLEKGQKTALIARNGTGKSTLLNIIAGYDVPDSGQVVIRNDITVSYLPQMDRFADNFSVLDAIFDAQTPTIQAIKEYEACMVLAETEHENIEVQQRLQKAIMEMDRLHAWDFEAKAKEILSRFGIHDIFKNINELSGGQRKKAALAKTLIADTDLLILDEPTNHLDVEMIEWLENYLKSANVTLLMVTHDRYFLDQVCNDIIELDHGQLYHYRGKYDYFVEKKAERLANAAAENEKLRQLFRKELEWVHTSPQARTTKARARINAFEELKKEVSKAPEQKQEGFKVRTERLGNKILEINNLDFAYPDNVLLDDFSYIFKKGEKCGIVGPNGTGKSTFLKLIMGELQADGGKITPGLTIQFGYFSQDGLPYSGNKRIIDLVKEQAEVIRMDNGNYMGASQFLNHFGFKYEQQYTYYEDLSGGEKRKLHLLITLLKNPNFLILDEPTNDFDIDTLNLLEDFLENYTGCILMVSHDRWFMNKLVDHIFVFEGHGKIKDYYGNYTEYRIERDKELKLQKRIAKINAPTPVKDNKSKPARAANPNKMTFKERKEFETLEVEIEQLEKEKAELIEKMNNGAGSSQELTDWSRRYQEVETSLDDKSMRWLELSEKE
ncbi:MAG: ABC-F family ATP-binding cassette domain-containing protein [Bacteroidales bacterium]|nr:ABC-F family ATP-binding cassette domain-containing protein [Bacteroidales bacterium]